MVSIENRMSYINVVNSSQKLMEFHHFLLGKNVSSIFKNGSELDDQFLKIVTSIQTNNKTEFEEIYSKKSKSNPSKDSPAPFVNDDYFIFCLIVGITHFSMDKTWIRSIISIRNRNATAITFENILNENYLSTTNQTEIVLVFLNLCDQSKIDINLMNSAYRNITENTMLLESRNDFQILCSFRAYDLIIEQKEVSEGNEITALKKFNGKFQKRMRFLSWILQIVFFFCLLYCLFKLPIYSPAIIASIEKYNFVFTLIGVSGFTLIGNQIPFVKNKTQELLMRLFGYPKELITKKIDTK